MKALHSEYVGVGRCR